MRLTPSEQDLVDALQRARGRPVSRGYLDSQIAPRWGTLNERHSPNTPKVLVCRVRRKLGRQVIETTEHGYRWAA